MTKGPILMRISLRLFFVAVFLFSLPIYSADVTEYLLAQPQTGFWLTAPHLAQSNQGKTLAIWLKHPGTHQNREIWGRLINAAGKPTGRPFPIVANQSVFAPDLVFNRFANEYLLVYSKDPGNLHIEVYAQRLSLRGRKIGAPVRVSSAADVNLAVLNDMPSVLLMPDAHYFIAWTRAGASGNSVTDEGLYGAVLDPDLTVSVPPALLHTLLRAPNIVRGPTVSDLAFHSGAEKIIVAVLISDSNSGGNPAFTHGTIAVDPQSLNAGTLKLINAKPSIVPRGAALLVRDDADEGFAFYSDARGIKRRKIGDDAQPEGKSAAAFKAPLRSKRLDSPVPLLASDPTFTNHDAVLFGVEDSSNQSARGTIWSQPLNRTGKPAAPPEIVKTGFDAASNLQGLSLLENSTFHEYLLVYTNGPLFVDPPSGLTLLKVQFQK